jgi:hypothetical protein
MTTFGGDTGYTAYLYDGVFNPAHHLSPLLYLNLAPTVYLPDSGEPRASVRPYTNHLYVAQANVVIPGGRINYHLSFVLLDNSTQQVIGYFSWDPYIKVISA